MQRQDYIKQLIAHSKHNIFLTGKAGTGKTTLLRQIVQETYKACVVAAPTGIAALNAGGVTLHSLLQLPLGTFIPDSNAQLPEQGQQLFVTPATLRRHVHLREQKVRLLQAMELLIIDEVSMLRADTLDLIDLLLRSVRRSPLPFGGVQVLFIGDLMQLPAGAQRPGERAACASQMKHPRAAGAAAFGRPARLDGAAPALIPARFEYEANVLHILEIQILRIGEVQARRLDAVQQKENLRGIGPRPDEFRSGIRCGDGPLGQLCSGRCALHATSLSRLEGAVAGRPGVLRGQKSDGA